MAQRLNPLFQSTTENLPDDTVHYIDAFNDLLGQFAQTPEKTSLTIQPVADTPLDIVDLSEMDRSLKLKKQKQEEAKLELKEEKRQQVYSLILKL